MRAVALALGALALAGCGGEAAQPARQILLVSGRDDHGLLVQKTVGLSPEIGSRPETLVRDGTLVGVQATRGEWIEVKTLEGRPASGWVNDYYLRGTAHLNRRAGGLSRNTQVELLEVEGGRVRVRALKSKRTGWVPRAAVAELPAG